MRESSLDEMVKIHDLRQVPTPPVRPEPGVRVILYTNEEDLPGLVGTQSAVEPTSASSGGLSPPPDEGIQNAHAIGDATGPTEAEQVGIEEDEHDGEFEADVFLPAEIQSTMPSAMPQALELIAPSEDELRAASIIQQAYKRTLSRRRHMSKTGMLAARRRFFAICFERSQEIAWKENSYYRLLFLGPLPHILLCLDVTQAAILSQKAVTKKCLLQNKHEELDDLGPKLTQLA
jgi:hypothetical protein